MKPTEYTLVEKPCIDALIKLGYTWLPPQQNQPARDTLNQVILRDIFITAINGNRKSQKKSVATSNFAPSTKL